MLYKWGIIVANRKSGKVVHLQKERKRRQPVKHAVKHSINSSKVRKPSKSVKVKNAKISKVKKRRDFKKSDLEEIRAVSIRISEAEKRKKEREKDKKNKNNINSGKMVITLAFAAIILYLFGSSIGFLTRDTIDFDTIQYGSIDEPKSAFGVIIKDEKVYNTTADGIVNFKVADNDKVKSGMVICTIKDDTVVSDMEKNLDQINKNILEMQENREDLSIFSGDVKRINKNIKDAVDTSAYSFSENNVKKMYELKNSIRQKLETRNQMLLTESRGSLTELVEKKTRQEQELSKNIVTLTSNESGIISYYIDGFENKFKFDNIDSITKEQTKMNVETADIKTSVKNGDGVFKIVSSNQWYIASYINKDYAENWEVGDNIFIYPVNTGDNKSLEVSIEKMRDEDKEVFVVFKATKELLNYIDKRNISFEISKSKKGYKIPNSAIVDRTILKIPVEYVQNDTVNKLTSEGSSIINISNSGSDEEGKFIYTLSEENNLKLGDVILNPKNLNERYTIQEVINKVGVYVINTGIAKFETINTENSSKNSTHTVIDPEKNSTIKIYDRILTKTDNISEEERVYN